jgi:RNA polymerase sigma-70 factor, ECF subfamily
LNTKFCQGKAKFPLPRLPRRNKFLLQVLPRQHKPRQIKWHAMQTFLPAIRLACMQAFFKLFRPAPAALALDHFEATLRAHAGQWFSACLRITKDASMAEDAVQEALLKAWDHRAQFREQAALASWVHSIAVHCSLDALRRGRPAQAFVDTASYDAGEDASALLDPYQLGAKQQWFDALERAMHQLTELERVCFVLKHIESYSLDELASRLGCSINSVKQALFRATKKLRGTLAHWQGVAP